MTCTHCPRTDLTEDDFYPGVSRCKACRLAQIKATKHNPGKRKYTRKEGTTGRRQEETLGYLAVIMGEVDNPLKVYLR